MICPVTDSPCRTNGCGPKCYKRDTLNSLSLTFHQWMHRVCERLAQRSRREVTEVYSSINLTEAKLAFIDGESPEEFNPML